jgi:hypothetical protein
MRILFLANSNELVPNPDGSPSRAELVREDLSPDFADVDIVVKAAWPTEKLPGIVGRWIDQYEPDLVYINVGEYWCLYESVPLRIQRIFGRFGTPLATAGLKAADTPWLAHNRVFRNLQQLTHLLVGGDTHFTPQEMVDCVMKCARVALQREGVVVVVDGQRGRRKFATTAPGLRRIERKRLAVHRMLQAECARLHITYESDETPQWQVVAKSTLQFQRDGFHLGGTAQQHMADEASALIRRAWAESHPTE